MHLRKDEALSFQVCLICLPSLGCGGVVVVVVEVVVVVVVVVTVVVMVVADVVLGFVSPSGPPLAISVLTCPIINGIKTTVACSPSFKLTRILLFISYSQQSTTRWCGFYHSDYEILPLKLIPGDRGERMYLHLSTYLLCVIEGNKEGLECLPSCIITF